MRHFADVMTDRRYRNLWIIDADGTDNRPLSAGKHKANFPRWSPDGESFIVSADLTEGAEMFAVGNPDIYEVALADGSARRLIDRDGPDAAVTVSPDGRHIAYVGYDDRRQGHQQNDLYVAGRDGSNVRNLTETYDRQEFNYWQRPPVLDDGGPIFWDLKGESLKRQQANLMGMEKRQHLAMKRLLLPHLRLDYWLRLSLKFSRRPRKSSTPLPHGVSASSSLTWHPVCLFIPSAS